MRVINFAGMRWFVLAALTLSGVVTGRAGAAQEAAPRGNAIPVCRAATANGDDESCLAGCAVSELGVTRAGDKAQANGLYAYDISGTLVCPPAAAGRPELINRRLMAQMAQRCRAAREASGSADGFRMLPTKIVPGKLQDDGRRGVTLSSGFQCAAARGVVERGWLSRLMDRLF